MRLDRLTDAAHCLRLSERRKIEAQMDDLERRFPQVFFAVYFGVLPQGFRVEEVGFWLLNHAAFGTHDITKRNEFGIILVIDPAAGTACFSVGYAMEALLGKMGMQRTLLRASKYLSRSEYGGAVDLAIRDLDRSLRSLGRAELRDGRVSQVHAVSTDLGLTPLRKSSRPVLGGRSHNEQPAGELR